ncbi:hypothetical protein FRC0201_01421 [Corynebacterium diphtheriae]|nr:hypothetical protein FRC0201_01421 [Corynebacterium diphtheriae]CAB0850121.1 hypothetical protein FRC0326_01493 [Corynebacterium diphtheriae]CAB0881894.1 hypothetical protein FRC0408_01393 [Corynebacterium diphtheriae]CAB1041722.1 hypothetical protein FRC0544_01588 [Corynebacterium diphtheriae]
MGAELGVGYISIVPEVSKISPGIAKALEGSQGVAEKQGQGLGSKLTSGISKTLKGGVLSVGATAGGLLAASMTKGMGRLTAIEGAQAKLSGLGNDAKTVAGVMENALSAVRGTAHGMGEAASTAAGMVAAGIQPGKELEQVLKTVGDTAAIAGRSMEDVGVIFGSVAARGKLQGDDMLQLMSSGIPVLQLLSKQLGVSSADVSEMVTKGKIDFATFEKAMREGVGGAALEMGNTFKGASANFGAALGRLGATGLRPFFDLSKDGLTQATKAVDMLEARLKPVASGVSEFLQKQAVPAVKDASSALIALGKSQEGQAVLKGTQEAFMGIVDAGRALAPVVVEVATTLSQASASLGVSTWHLFVTALQAGAAALEAVSVPLGAVTGFLADHPSLVTAAVAAWAGFKTLPAATEKISSALQNLNDRVGGATDGFHQMRPAFTKLREWSEESGAGLTRLDAAMQAAGDRGTGTMQKMAQAYTHAVGPLRDVSVGYRNLAQEAKGAALSSKDAFTSVEYLAQQAGRSVQSSVTRMAATTTGVGAAAFTGLKSAASGVMGLFGGPWGFALAAGTTAMVSLSQANHNATAAQERMEAAASKASVAVSTYYTEMAGKAGVLSDAASKAAETVVEGSLAQMNALGELSGKMVLSAPDMGWLEQGFWNKDFREYRSRVTEMGDQLKAVKEAAADLNIPMSELNSIVANGGAEYERLVAKLRSSGESGQAAAKQLQEVRGQIEQMDRAARDLDPAMAGSAQSMKVLADAGSSATDKLKALRDIMDKLTGGTLSHDEAQARLVEDVEKATESVSKMSEKLSGLGPIELDPDGSIDTTTKAGKEAFNTFHEISDSMTEAAANGVSVNEVFSQQEKNLQDMQNALGLTDGQFQGLMQSYGLTRDMLGLPLQLKGADTVQQQVALMKTGLADLEVGHSVQITPPDPAVMVALDQIGFKVTTLPNGNVKVETTADTAKDKLGDLEKIVGDLNGKLVKMTADLDTEPLALKAEDAKRIGRELDQLDVSPEADLIIQKLLQGKDIAVGELQILSAEKAVPTVSLEKSLLEAGVDESKARLTELHNKKTKPKVDADTTDATSKINGVINLLSRVPGFKKITLQAVRVGSWLSGHADGGIAGYAGGGKLPVTGPGTSTVDGILGVDGAGMPVARVNAGEWVINRKSSQDYHDVLQQINAGTFPRYESGGIILRSAEQIKAAVAQLDGTPYMRGGWSPAGVDCSGGVSATVNAALGLPIFDSRMSTVTIGQWLAAKGAILGDGTLGDIRIGWWDRGGGANGHTAIQIQDGTYIESGGNTGGGFTIGRSAGPLEGRGFDQFAHFRGDGIGMTGDPDSHVGASSRGNADFGKASDLYELAYKTLQSRATLYDQGGVMGHGEIGRNASGKNELVLTNSQWAHLSETARSVMASGNTISGAASTFAKAVDSIQGGFARSARGLGGDFLGNTELVRDAEQGLAELRKQIAAETSDVAEAERNLADAKSDLAKSDRDAADKLADREAALNKAREKGDPEKIAAAERDLAKAREDLPDKSRSAAKKVEQAEDKLREAREKVTDQLLRLEAAERAVSAARLKAASEFVTQLTEHIAAGFNRLGAFFDEMARLAGIVDKTRQATSKLEMQQQTNLLERVKSLQDLQIKEWDVARVRARGAVSVAKAEEELEKARQQAAVMGATSIEAMKGAMDRFYRTGVFAVEEVASSVVENSRLVKAAEWGVQKAKVQNALDMLEASQAQKLAQFAVVEATLKQAQAAKLLQAHTEALKQQTAQLYGMTPNQATGAARGFGGIGKLIGGLGKIIGGVLGGLAGFAAGGPLGAVAGAGMALTGLGEAVRGGIDISTNRKEMREAWKNMDGGSKAGIVAGALGGAALTLGGGALAGQLGPDAAVAGANLGSQLMDATIGGVQYNIASKVEKAQRDLEDRVNAINREVDMQNLNLQLNQATNQVDYLKQKDKLLAELEYTKLKQEIEKSDNERVRAALEAAANVEKLRALSEKTGEMQTGELRKMNSSLEQLLDVTRRQADASDKARLANENRLVGSLSAVDSVGFDRARL